jgi:hypothetical protein
MHMKLGTIGRIGGVLALTVGLAGCFDMTTDIEVTSATAAKATVTEIMGADIYAMIKSGQGSPDDKFCGKDGEKLTENADGSATCVFTSEGAFADLKFGDSGTAPTFTAQPDGTIKVAVATKGMAGDLGKENDPQTAAMMKKLFDGHFLTIRFGGGQVTDSNMAISDDKTYAEQKIPFLDLINGTANLPDELYAVVTAP